MSDSAKKPFNGADTACLRMDSPCNLMIINAMFIAERMDFSDFRATIINRFLSFSRFMARPALKSGQYLWENDPYFDIDKHVKKSHCPALPIKKYFNIILLTLLVCLLMKANLYGNFYLLKTIKGGVPSFYGYIIVMPMVWR